MIISRFAVLSPERKALILAVLAVFIISIINSGYYTLQYGGTDLRARVVGARLLNTDKSPYFYRWSSGETERLADPNARPDRLTNGVSVAPGALYIQSLFTNLDYPTLRIIWTVFQYILALSIVGFILSNRNNLARANMHIIVIGGIFFLCSQIWFYNIERGQIYILYTFFFWMIYQLYILKKAWSYFLTGVILMIATYCRPTFIVVLIPFLFTLNRRVIAGVFTSAIPLAVHACMHPRLWQDYLSAMQLYANSATNSKMQTGSIISPVYPIVIEGTKNLTIYKDFAVGGVTPLGIWLSTIFHSGQHLIYLIIYALLICILIFLFFKRVDYKDPDAIILFGFLLYITAECIMPVSRGGYNMIQWLFPVLLLLQKGYLSNTKLILLIIGLSLTISFPFPFHYFYSIGELIIIYCLGNCIFNRFCRDNIKL